MAAPAELVEVSMRLVNYGPGEIADRLSILALKITYGTEAGKAVDHFERERNALITKLPPSLPVRVLEAIFELGAVNAVIWQDTDSVRVARQWPQGDPQTYELLTKCCIRLQVMNDRRAELITLINVNTGNDASQEKV